MKLNCSRIHEDASQEQRRCERAEAGELSGSRWSSLWWQWLLITGMSWWLAWAIAMNRVSRGSPLLTLLWINWKKKKPQASPWTILHRLTNFITLPSNRSPALIPWAWKMYFQFELSLTLEKMYLGVLLLHIVGGKHPLLSITASFPPIAFIFVNLDDISFSETEVASHSGVTIQCDTLWIQRNDKDHEVCAREVFFMAIEDRRTRSFVV